METIQIKDKRFKTFISEEQILKEVARVADEINRDLADANPLFVSVLNGSFMFTSDLMKHLTIPCEISFVKLASYQGTCTSGCVKELVGLNNDITGRTVVIVEDIVDTGRTLSVLLDMFRQRGAASVKLCTLLDKPEGRVTEVPVDYECFTVPDKFVVGYGLDYNQKYRNLPYIGVLDFIEE